MHLLVHLLNCWGDAQVSLGDFVEVNPPLGDGKDGDGEDHYYVVKIEEMFQDTKVRAAKTLLTPPSHSHFKFCRLCCIAILHQGRTCLILYSAVLLSALCNNYPERAILQGPLVL